MNIEKKRKKKKLLRTVKGDEDSGWNFKIRDMP